MAKPCFSGKPSGKIYELALHLLRTRASLLKLPKMAKMAGVTQANQERKKSTKINFWVRRPPGGMGVFHVKGWWPKSSCPPSKVCFPWVLREGIWDVPGILLGCPGPLGVFKKFVQKKFVRIFRSLAKAWFSKGWGWSSPIIVVGITLLSWLQLSDAHRQL